MSRLHRGRRQLRDMLSDYVREPTTCSGVRPAKEERARERRRARRGDCADFLERIVYFLDNELDAGRLRRRARSTSTSAARASSKYDLQRTVKTVVARSCTEARPGGAARPGAASGSARSRSRSPRAEPARRSSERRAPDRTPARGLGAVGSRCEPSGVGALAVVRGLLLARAALATGLAHGVLLEKSVSTHQLSQDGCACAAEIGDSPSRTSVVESRRSDQFVGGLIRRREIRGG